MIVLHKYLKNVNVLLLMFKGIFDIDSVILALLHCRTLVWDV